MAERASIAIGKSLAAVTLMASLWFDASGAARAELPPQYTVWQDFAAIVAKQEIAAQLGVVDRIERIGAGRFSVHSAGCAIVATVVREAAKSPDGREIPGPSRIVRVDLGAKQCKS